MTSFCSCAVRESNFQLSSKYGYHYASHAIMSHDVRMVLQTSYQKRLSDWFIRTKVKQSSNDFQLFIRETSSRGTLRTACATPREEDLTVRLNAKAKMGSPL